MCPYALALDIALSGRARCGAEALGLLRLLGVELDIAMRAAAGLVRAGALAY